VASPASTSNMSEHIAGAKWGSGSVFAAVAYNITKADAGMRLYHAWDAIRNRRSI